MKGSIGNNVEIEINGINQWQRNQYRRNINLSAGIVAA
jgi:hypothetical protein